MNHQEENFERPEGVGHGSGDTPVSLAGVARTSWGNRWFAQVQHRGKRHYLGTWNSPEDAHAVYLAAKERLQDNNP